MTADLVEYCFPARTTGTLVAELLANVISAFQWTTTRTSADVFRLKPIVNGTWGRIYGTAFPFNGHTLSGLAFAGTASFVASMSTTVESDPADAHALRRFDVALVANGCRGRPATLASNLNLFEARTALSRMTKLFTKMAT